MTQRGVPGPEIVERDAAAGIAQGFDKADRFLDVFERRGLGDFDDQAAPDIGSTAQQGSQGAQPLPVARRQTRHVEPEPDPRMGGEFLGHLTQHIAVDQPDHPDLLGRRDKLAAGHQAPRRVAQSQQALVIIDLAGGRADDRLKCEKQPVLSQRRVNRRADRQVVLLPEAPRLPLKALHSSAAPAADAADRMRGRPGLFGSGMLRLTTRRHGSVLAREAPASRLGFGRAGWAAG